MDSNFEKELLEDDDMVEVEVVHYYLPFGKSEVILDKIPASCLPAYEEMRECGCQLTAEILRGGSVSLAIEHEEGDFALVICKNGPEVIDAIRELFGYWNISEFHAWIDEIKRYEEEYEDFFYYDDENDEEDED